MTTLVLATALPGAAAAQDDDRALDRFTIGTGLFDAIEQDDPAAAFGLEWRPGVRYFDVVAPFAGAMATSDGSAYGYVGVGLDFLFGDHFAVMPFTGVGLYSDGGTDKDLGHPIEFRSGVELGYRLDSGVQIGVSGFHISNGDLGDDNPGTEVLMLQLSVPSAFLFD